VFVEARRALLTALHALASQNSAIIVAGAQAIYLRTGDAGLAIAPFTTDGDLALDPSLLSDDPRLELAMRAAHFDLKTNPDGNVEPGIWLTEVTIRGNREVVPIDLIVPRGAGAQGSWRGARLGTKPLGASWGWKQHWSTTLRCSLPLSIPTILALSRPR
jgi:hypothetical protein